MTALKTEFRTQRAIPNMKQVLKIRNQLEFVKGVNVEKQIDYIFDGVNSWEDGYNIGTLSLAFDSTKTEEIKGTEYPNLDSKTITKKKIHRYKISSDCDKLIIYPSRGPTGKGEWRYHNMQNLEDFSIIENLDNSIIKALQQWIKTVKRILKENPQSRNEEHKKIVAGIRYEIMRKNRMLKQLEKKSKKVVVSNNTKEEEGEQDQNETDEK